jgi:hypothetical protein
MFFIPGFLISIATFPGVIVHEFAHRLFADLTGVAVYKVCYFRVGNPAGYVLHGPTPSLRSALLIAVGPLIVNTLLCSLITFPAILAFHVSDISGMGLVQLLLLWAGFSMGMHAIPSNTDMQGLVAAVKRQQGGGPLLLAARFFAGLFFVANLLRFFWFDAIYALLVSLALPALVAAL